jgi:hypothetical protein
MREKTHYGVRGTLVRLLTCVTGHKKPRTWRGFRLEGDSGPNAVHGDSEALGADGLIDGINRFFGSLDAGAAEVDGIVGVMVDDFDAIHAGGRDERNTGGRGKNDGHVDGHCAREECNPRAMLKSLGFQSDVPRDHDTDVAVHPEMPDLAMPLMSGV